jgi:predicted RNA polymerase sigma factor
VRGDLLAKLGRSDEAARELRCAAELTRNEREMMLGRSAALDASRRS